MSEKTEKAEVKAPAPPPGQQVAKAAPVAPALRTIVDDVSNKITQMQETKQLDFPSDYSVQNAVRAASLVLQDLKTKTGIPVFEACTPVSIANSIMKMAVLGMNPLKRQGSFIIYGDRLEWQNEIGGNIALAKRFGKLKSINANVIYEGEEPVFSVDPNTGRMKLVSHEPNMANIDINKIKGAYAVSVFTDGSSECTVMSMTQIRQAWAQAIGGETPAHKKFPDEMAKKTVMNRALKHVIRSSDDAALMSDDEDPEPPELSAKNAAVRPGAVKEIVIKPNESVDVSDVAPATAPTPTTEKSPFG